MSVKKKFIVFELQIDLYKLLEDEIKPNIDECEVNFHRILLRIKNSSCGTGKFSTNLEIFRFL